MDTAFDYNQLDAGIVDVVRALHSEGFQTTDSGDGSKAPWMEGAMDVPMVVVKTTEQMLCSEARRMVAVLRLLEPARQWKVDASFNPDDEMPLLVATADGLG